MSTQTQTTIVTKTNREELEFATFYVGDILLGIDIQEVQEINKHLEITRVPHVPEYVRGVINLRGEVVTVLNLRNILALGQTEFTDQTRLVVITNNEENIGLLVDRIADVVIANTGEIEPAPANVSGIDGRFFQGVYKLEHDLLVILHTEEIINMKPQESTVTT